MIVRLSIKDLVAIVRAAFVAGAWAWDQTESPEPPEPTDGQLLGIITDHLGIERFTQAKDAGPRITAAAIRGEVAEVLEYLRSGALLSIGDELRGRDLSEAFSALVYDLLSDQIEQTEGGGIYPGTMGPGQSVKDNE